MINKITTICFYKSKLTKHHLKVLKGHILFMQKKYMRIIFCDNNLSDIDLDYFLFGNNDIMSNSIQNNLITLYVSNNFGVFKEKFIEKIKNKLTLVEPS